MTCKNVNNSAARPNISIKFGTNVLNWTLNDPRNLYCIQASYDKDIDKFRKENSNFMDWCAKKSITRLVGQIFQ